MSEQAVASASRGNRAVNTLFALAATAGSLAIVMSLVVAAI